MFGLPLWLAIVILVLAWILFFAWVMMLVARLGGWRTLAEKYPVEVSTIDGTTWRWQSMKLGRFTSYNNILKVTATRDGVLFQMPLFFKAGHRPFFVPWEEIEVTRTESFFGKGATLTMQRVPDRQMHISAKLADRMKKEAGEAWPEHHPDRVVP